MTMRVAAMVAVALALAAGCTTFPPAPTPHAQPALDGDALIARDGARLHVDRWLAEDPEAVLIAVHGMNDYGRAFEDAAVFWSAAGISVYAYDQRGFGRSPGFGRWAGAETLQADLVAAIGAVRRVNPGKPVFVVGHSMGAAVILTAGAEQMLDVDGVILAAPGVWGGAQMPVPYRAFLNVFASFAPDKTMTGERAGRQSTDNIPILRRMLADPLVIKETRLDAVLGVVRVMGKAYKAAGQTGGRVLFLYGAKDQIIPLRAMRTAAARLCGDVDLRTYEEGWHLLFRDLQAQTVWREVADWVQAEANRNDAAGPKLRFGPAAPACEGAG